MLFILNPVNYIQRLGKLFTASQLRSLIPLYSKKSGRATNLKKTKKIRSNHGRDLGRRCLGRKRHVAIQQSKVLTAHRSRIITAHQSRINTEHRHKTSPSSSPQKPECTVPHDENPATFFRRVLHRARLAERHVQQSSAEISPQSKTFLEQLSALEIAHTQAQVGLWPNYINVRCQLERNEKNLEARMDEMQAHAEKANRLRADDTWEQEEYERKLQFGRALPQLALGRLMQEREDLPSWYSFPARFTFYEVQWDILTGKTAFDGPIVITFSNMPFPLLEDISSPFDLDTPGVDLAICHFIFHRRRPQFAHITAKRRLELEMQRWDSDFLACRVLPLVVEDERKAVEEAAARIIKVLLRLKAELDSIVNCMPIV